MDLAVITNMTVMAASVVAVAAFVFDVARRQRTARDEAVLKWQIVLLQTLFQEKNTSLSFADVRTHYLARSQQFTAYVLKGADHSDERLRSVLIKMVADRILDQVGDDRYGLFTSKAIVGELFDALRQIGVRGIMNSRVEAANAAIKSPVEGAATSEAFQ